MDENNTTPQATPENAQPTPAAQPEAVQPTAAQPETAQVQPTAAQPTQPVQPTAVPEATQQMPATAPAPVEGAVPGAPQSPAVNVAAPQAAAPSPTGALVCGILSIVFCFIPIVGIVLGIVAIVLAGKYFKAGGTQGTGKGGRICGIVGIVLSAIVMIANIIIVVMGVSFLANNYDTLGSTATSTSSNAPIVTEVESADEAGAAAEAQLELIAQKDPETVAAVAAIMQETFDSAFATASAGEDIPAITLSSLGVDPTALAEAMMDGFTYEELYIDDESGTAEATYSIETRSIYSVAIAFSSNVQDEMSDFIATADPSNVSIEQFYHKMGEALMAAVTNEEPTMDSAELMLTEANGTWTVDADSWDDLLDELYAFE